MTDSGIALVSGSDANYYPLLREWLHSVQRFEAAREVDICILDAGLAPEQVAELRRCGVSRIVKPPFPEGIPEKRVRGKEYLKACLCRPFLPEIFPGYETYMWMDSDTWVQNWDAVALFLRGAREKKDRLFITSPGADRHARRVVRVKWLWRIPYRVASFYFGNGVRAFGFQTARKLMQYNVLSAGAFAMDAQAPHWVRWQQLVVTAAVRGRLFPAEQLSLGVLAYLEGYKAELLPAYTHWVCDRPPLWDSGRKQFVEPFLPHVPLGILHLSGVDDMRANRAATVAYETLDGGTVHLNCRYPYFDGGIVAPPERA